MAIKDFVAREKGMDLVVQVYAYSRLLPPDEKHVVIPQLRRAVFSIPLNLSEGYGRSSKVEFSRFVDIALGSAREVQTILELCHRHEYPNPQVEIESTEEVIRILIALVRSLRKS